MRRAVGATQKDDRAQFLSEAVMISLAGGIAGIIARRRSSRPASSTSRRSHDRVADVRRRGVRRVGRRRTRVRHRAGDARPPSRIRSSVCATSRYEPRQAPSCPHPMRLSTRRLPRRARCPPLAARAQGTPLAAAKPLTLQDAIAMAQQQRAGGAGRAQRRATRRGGATTRSTRACCRSSFLTGNAANLNHGINPITAPDGSTQFVGQSQNQSSLAARVQPGDSAHRRHDLRRLADQPHRPVRHRRQQALPDVAGRRQLCSRICSSRATIVWDERVQSLERARRRARRISRRARTSPATPPTRSSISTRSR